MQNNVKSSSVAGVLGVFLGAFGGHDWYLNNTKKAITHVCLCVGGIILLMIGIILMSLLRDMPALNALSICVVVLAYIIIVGNLIWGFIEGVIILAQGDAGLAAKGYQVAVPDIHNSNNQPVASVPTTNPVPAFAATPQNMDNVTNNITPVATPEATSASTPDAATPSVDTQSTTPAAASDTPTTMQTQTTPVPQSTTVPQPADNNTAPNATSSQPIEHQATINTSATTTSTVAPASAAASDASTVISSTSDHAENNSTSSTIAAPTNPSAQESPVPPQTTTPQITP